MLLVPVFLITKLTLHKLVNYCMVGSGSRYKIYMISLSPALIFNLFWLRKIRTSHSYIGVRTSTPFCKLLVHASLKFFLLTRALVNLQFFSFAWLCSQAHNLSLPTIILTDHHPTIHKLMYNCWFLFIEIDTDMWYPITFISKNLLTFACTFNLLLLLHNNETYHFIQFLLWFIIQNTTVCMQWLWQLPLTSIMIQHSLIPCNAPSIKTINNHGDITWPWSSPTFISYHSYSHILSHMYHCHCKTSKQHSEVFHTLHKVKTYNVFC